MVKLAISSEYSEYGLLREERSEVAFIELQLHFTGRIFADGFEERIERLAQRSEPQAVVHHLRVIQRELLLVVERGFIQRERFELADGEHDERAAGSFVAAARLHADEAIFHQIDAADAVLRADGVERFQPVRRPSSFCRLR